MTIDKLLEHRSIEPDVSVERAASVPRRRRGAWITAVVLASVGLGWLVSFGENRVYAKRLVNPTPPRPLPHFEWLGLSSHGFWVPFLYVISWSVVFLVVGIFVRHWRRTGGRHPALPIFLAMLPLSVPFDPIINWAMYVPYDPGLFHWPVTWPIMSLAPTVEPVWILMAAYAAFFLAPAIGLFNLHRRFIASRARPGSWVERHPLLSIFLFALPIAAAFDILTEQWMIHIWLYKYTQTFWLSLHWGRGYLPFVEIIQVAVYIAFFTTLLHRDDGGRTVCCRLSQRVTLFRRLSMTEQFTAFAMVAGIMTASLAVFGTARVAGLEDRVIGDWPYRTVKTYDPDGLLRTAGQPGPYFDGIGCTASRCGK